MERCITEDEEWCYRLRHHDFAGLTTRETAKKMGITFEKVRRLLKSLKAKAPQLFPILTYRQQLIYWLHTYKGLSQHKIAKCLGTTQSNVSAILNRIQISEPSGFGDTVAYEEDMDSHIIYRF